MECIQRFSEWSGRKAEMVCVHWVVGQDCLISCKPASCYTVWLNSFLLLSSLPFSGWMRGCDGTIRAKIGREEKVFGSKSCLQNLYKTWVWGGNVSNSTAFNRITEIFLKKKNHWNLHNTLVVVVRSLSSDLCQGEGGIWAPLKVFLISKRDWWRKAG